MYKVVFTKCFCMSQGLTAINLIERYVLFSARIYKTCCCEKNVFRFKYGMFAHNKYCIIRSFNFRYSEPDPSEQGWGLLKLRSLISP